MTTIQQPKLTSMRGMHQSSGRGPAVSTPFELGNGVGDANELTEIGLAGRKRQRDSSDETPRQHQRLRGGVIELHHELQAVVNASRCGSPTHFAGGQQQQPQTAVGAGVGVPGVGISSSVPVPGSKDAAVLASVLASMADERTQVQSILARRLRGMASTSGRGSEVSAPNPDLTLKDCNSLSTLQQLAAVTQGESISQFLRAQQQGEQIKALLEERRQQQILLAMNNEYTQRLRVAGFEIERHRLRTAELEEHVKRLINELSISHSRLRNSEMVVSTLRSNLEHAVALSREEQTGDSDDVDDAASSYESDLLVSHARALHENEELREQRACRVCRTNEASTLLLPCRHLCLCHGCEGQLDSCPLCRQPKAASVLVYMS
eukprot:TRINITY_DN1902_c0_g1_i1.p1 TRINITY_DN1902_c0_g1~~TRINITY_DN1902_c0_g1_i1.p1  ORF type:complete len:378 (-),score=68.70 TRINITY_DN1902_c0_g1_i1:977-2110(-)